MTQGATSVDKITNFAERFAGAYDVFQRFETSGLLALWNSYRKRVVLFVYFHMPPVFFHNRTDKAQEQEMRASLFVAFWGVKLASVVHDGRPFELIWVR